MNSNFFFKKKVINYRDFIKNKIKKNFIINDIKPLHIAQKNDLSFLTQLNIKMRH